MAAAESSAGRIVKGEAAVAIQRAAEVVVVSTGSDAWGDQYMSVRHRGFTVHWGQGNSQNYLEVVLDAVARVAAGTTVEVAAGRVRAHVVDAIGEERLEPETETAANEESGSTELGEAAATEEAAKEKKREKNRRKKQRRQIRKEAAAAEEATTDTVRAGEVVVEKAAAANSLEAAALAVSEAAAALTAYSETKEGATVVAAATVGGAEAEKGETERMREKVGDTALGGTGVQTVQTTEMVVITTPGTQ